jgi:nitronate monooxygenase
MLNARLRLPAIASPMPIVSRPDRLIARSTAGIGGRVPGVDTRAPELPGEWPTRIGAPRAGLVSSHH